MSDRQIKAEGATAIGMVAIDLDSWETDRTIFLDVQDAFKLMTQIVCSALPALPTPPGFTQDEYEDHCRKLGDILLDVNKGIAKGLDEAVPRQRR